MGDYPIAVLRFKWRDQSGSIPTWPDNAYTGCFLPIRPSGAARFWQDCSNGLYNLEGSQIFPWRVLSMDMPQQWTPRFNVLVNTIERGLDEGFPLEQFSHIVAVVIPNLPWMNAAGGQDFPIDGGFQDVSTRGGYWRCALLSEDYAHDFIAHEVGHVLGVDHPWQILSTGPDDYGSPYCVMSASGYGGEPSYWKGTPDPALPVRSEYWDGMAPRPAAATLLRYLPTYSEAGYVRDLGNRFATMPRSIKINALDTARKPVAAFVTSPLSGKQYIVEYRRAVGWDRAVKPGVVIHSIEPESAAGGLRRVFYEGRILLPHEGDLDWRSPDKEITVIVDQLADDGTAVEVTVGGATLIDKASVSLAVDPSGSPFTVEEGRATVFVPPVCGEGDYAFYIDHQESIVTLTATAIGFASPVFKWKVNQTELPITSPFIADPTRFTTSVASTFPRPNSTTTEQRNARLHYFLSANTLILTGLPEDGNYKVFVEVTVSEQSPGPGTPTATESTIAKMTGVMVRYEDAYYEAVEKCVQMLKDVSEKYSEDSRLKPFKPKGPLDRNISIIRQWQKAAAAKNPILSEQLSQAVRKLSRRQ